MKHEAAVLPFPQIITGAAGVWAVSAGFLVPWINGYIIGIGFGWTGGGAPNVTGVEIQVGTGPNAANVTAHIGRILPTMYFPNPGPPAAAAPASILVTQWSGHVTSLNTRAPIPGGIPITANNTLVFARVTTAAGAVFAPTVVPELVVWVP